MITSYILLFFAEGQWPCLQFGNRRGCHNCSRAAREGRLNGWLVPGDPAVLMEIGRFLQRGWSKLLIILVTTTVTTTVPSTTYWCYSTNQFVHNQNPEEKSLRYQQITESECQPRRCSQWTTSDILQAALFWTSHCAPKHELYSQHPRHWGCLTLQHHVHKAMLPIWHQCFKKALSNSLFLACLSPKELRTIPL